MLQYFKTGVRAWGKLRHAALEYTWLPCLGTLADAIVPWLEILADEITLLAPDMIVGRSHRIQNKGGECNRL